MNKKIARMTTMMCVMKSKELPVPALWSEIEKMMHDPKVQRICDEIKLLDGKDKDALSKKKKELPVFMPHACRFVNDGSRQSVNAVPSGLVMLDIDKVENARGLYETLIEPHTRVAENKIYFVAITPSGHGLRVIAERMDGETIVAGQQRLVGLFGLESYDGVVKDMARASFVMPWSYVLYCDRSGLDFASVEEADAIVERFSKVKEEKTTVVVKQIASMEKACSDAFRGVPYAMIIEELTELLGGTPSVGERNVFYYSMVKNLRYICDFDASTCVGLLPDYGLSMSERSSTAMSAVGSPRKGHIPDLVNRAIVSASRRLELSNSSDVVLEKELKMPHLPRVLEVICNRLPEAYRPAMVIASLPILGALATRIRFRYLDKQEHSFSFMSCVVAPAATGKSFIRKPLRYLLTPINERDVLEREKEREYKEAKQRAKNSKVQPTNPCACPRNNGINVSVSKLLELLTYSEGRHLIGIGEEIDTLTKSEKAGSWSQKSDIYRLAFDNAMYGQNYMSDNSFSAHVAVYYNLLLTGTPGGMYRFFKDVEDGLVTRVAFAQLPDMFGARLPVFESYSNTEVAEIVSIARSLDESDGVLQCNQLCQRIDRWLEEKRELAIREDSRSIDTLRRRSAVMGFRAGMLAYLLNGYRYDRHVGDFAIWCSEYIFRNQYELFGQKIDEKANLQIASMERRGQVISLLQELPEVFSRSQLIALRMRRGQSGQIYTVISRWRSAGYIENVDSNTYKKTKKCYG